MDNREKVVGWHATTPRKLARYQNQHCILPPVRFWVAEESARAWGRSKGRTVLLRFKVEVAYPLPDHRPRGHAWWTPDTVRDWDVVMSDGGGGSMNWTEIKSTISERIKHLTTGGAGGDDDARAEAERLRAERDEALAEVERLRAERDEARSVLREVRSWRRAAVGLEPRPTIDAETLDRRIDAVLGPPYREKDPSDPLRMVRALAKAERERDDARAEVERLKAENERLRERLQVDPGGSDRIDELEQAMQFTRHELEVAQDALDLLRAEAREAREAGDEPTEIPPGRAFASAVDDAVHARHVAQRERDAARAEVERLKAERDEAQALAAEMWKNASDWTGPTASSHYRSEISERLVRLKAEETPAPVKIDELEQAMQFVRHELEVTRDERNEARAEVERLKQELSCGHAFHKCSVAEKEAEIRRTQAVEAERDEAREAYLTIRRERDEARANTIRHAQAVQLERERLAACLVRIGADLDLSNPDDNAVDAAIGILDAYRETGPWPGCPLRLPEAETEPDES